MYRLLPWLQQTMWQSSWRKDEMQLGGSQLVTQLHKVSVHKSISSWAHLVTSQGPPVLVDIFYWQFCDKMNVSVQLCGGCLFAPPVLVTTVFTLSAHHPEPQRADLNDLSNGLPCLLASGWESQQEDTHVPVCLPLGWTWTGCTTLLKNAAPLGGGYWPR